MKGIDPALAIIAAFLAFLVPVLVVVVARKWRLVKSAEDYLIAGRRAHWAIVCASVTSLYIWGSSVMGSAEGATIFGVSGIWMYPTAAVGLFIFGIYAIKLRELFPYALSFTEYFRHRFDTKMHILALISATATTFTGAWIQGLAAGHVLVGSTGGAIPYWVGVLFLGVAVLIYTLTAGLWGSLMATWVYTVLAMPICAIVGVACWAAIGGPGPIMEMANTLVADGKLSQEIFNVFRGTALINYLIPLCAWGLFSLPMQQDYWQTAFAIKDPKTVGKPFRHAAIWWYFMPIISGSVGFAALILMKSGKLPEVPGSQAYAALAGQYLPAGITFLFVWLIFAATMGTVGAAMMAIGNIIGNDIYRSYINKNATDDQVKKVARWIVFFATVAVIAVSFYPMSIIMLVIWMPMYGAPFVFGLVFSQYKKWVSSTPTFIAGIVGFFVGMYMFYGLGQWGWGMLAAFASAALIVLIGSKAAPADFDFEQLKKFKAGPVE